MGSHEDRRLIEDYLPIQAISAEASREKSVRKGHISTLHLWWARRPLVACRAAVYGALVPASRFVPENGPDNKKQSLGRANAAKFVESLCKYPGNPATFKKAQDHILEAHAERLTFELEESKAEGAKPAWVEEFKFTGEQVTVEDIQTGKAPRPRVLDMFAGGGAIPLEALRLGCETYALDLNPVAYIIELCTLVYPQKYGKPDPNTKGMTGPKNDKGETTWGGLADEVRYWGEWVFKKVEEEIGDLYPLIPDPEFKGRQGDRETQLIGRLEEEKTPLGYLIPVAYLWTRTVTCKKPSCQATVPLAKLFWVSRERGDSDGRYVAVNRGLNLRTKKVSFSIIEGHSREQVEQTFEGTKAGNIACPFCGTVNDDDYVKGEGMAQRTGYQLIAIATRRPGEKGKHYIASDDAAEQFVPSARDLKKKLAELTERSGITVPNEPIITDGKQSIWVDLYGLTDFGKIFTTRQCIVGIALSAFLRELHRNLISSSITAEHACAVCSFIAMAVDRHLNQNNSLAIYNAQGETIEGAVNDKTLPMAWDFPEANPFSGVTGSFNNAVQWVVDVARELGEASWSSVCKTFRGSATIAHFPERKFDAVITDPPYYDNVSYAILSDFFYVWLKRMIGTLYPEHLAGLSAPKRSEVVMDSRRHSGDVDAARVAYQEMIQSALTEACKALKPYGILACVYAHKTTLGWATLIDALRRSGFLISEAWPIETERKGGKKVGKATLTSSIFLVARKRSETKFGSYEEQVKPDLGEIVRERVATLWDMGISGADLVIACVGAGLRAFTRFARVEYANGEEVPAERFLMEVETVVLNQILNRLSKEVGGNGDKRSLAGVDPATCFYTLWRYTYRTAELDAGEAIVFANGTHVELDGPGSVTYGARPLVEKKTNKYRLRDYTQRGEDEKLGMPDTQPGKPVPLIDVLHRTLWLMENRPVLLPEFLHESGVNREQMRLVAQALAGPALKGGELGDFSPTSELSALTKLMANWRSVVEDADLTLTQREGRRIGQHGFDFGKEKKK